MSDGELERLREEVTQMAAELEATNRGLIALYAELGQAQAAEAHLAAIVRSSADAMFSMSPDKAIVTWNDAAERLLGYPAEEITGQPVEVIVPEHRRAELDQGIARLQAGERLDPFDTVRVRKDGTLLEVSVTLSAVPGPDGRPHGYAAVLRDLTDRRRVDAALASAQAWQEVASDRERIARDLHDLVIQRLFAAGMKLESAARFAVRPEARDQVLAVVDELDRTIKEIRVTIFALEHTELRTAGLRGRVLDLAAEAGGSIGFEPAVRFSGPVDSLVPDPVGEHVVAVVTEALSNVSRHSGATVAGIDLEVSAGPPPEILVRITDNGRGIGEPTRSSGLRNMGERAESLGGSLELGAPAGGGTVIVWRVPLDG